MPAISLFGSDAPAAVRRPVFEVRFGDAAAWTEGLVELTVELGLGPSVDAVEAVAAAEPLGAVAVGDTGSVALGYADASTDDVFSGTVESVSHRLDGTLRLTAANGGAALSRLRLDRSFEQPSAADVIRDLAGEAGVAVGTVEADLDFDFYVVDGRRGGFEHVAELARRCGCRSTFTAADELEVAAFVPAAAVASFAWGVDLLALEVSPSAPAVNGFRAFGEGAAGSQGRDAASWLVKDPAAVTHEAGEAPRRDVSDRALRGAAAVKTTAAGHAALAGLGAVYGRLLVPGTPALVPGATFEVTGAPNGDLNGSFMVRRVVHRYAKDTGFLSRASFVGADGGGLAGLVGGLL